MKRLLIVVICLLAGLVGCGKDGGDNSTQATRFDVHNDLSKATTLFYGKDSKQANMFGGVTTGKNMVGLCFEGLPEKKEMDQLLSLLKQYNVKATFFIDGIVAVEKEQSVKEIVSAGHDIQNYTLHASGKLERMNTREALNSIVKSNAIIQSITGKEPTMIRCNHTVYTDDVRSMIGACEIPYIVTPGKFLAKGSLNSQWNAQCYVQNLMYGSIVSIKLTEGLTEDEIDRPISMIKSGKPASLPAVFANPQETVINTVERLLISAKTEQISFASLSDLQGQADVNLERSFATERIRNNGTKAEILKNIYTTKYAFGLTFRQLGSKDQVNQILNTLKKDGRKATFFVSMADMGNMDEEIKRIVEEEHELGNAGSGKRTMMNLNYQSICEEIYKCQQLMQSKYGVMPKVFMTPDGKVNDIILEAASSMGYQVAGYNKNPAPVNGVTREKVTYYFRNGLQAGDVVSVSVKNCMDIRDAVTTICEKALDSRNEIVTLSRLQNMKEEPINPKTIKGYDDIKKNRKWPSVNAGPYVIEKVNTREKVVFLTFDDWGSDKTVYSILDILEEKDAKGTFFVRGNGPTANPMLLRAIDQKGHGIGNHTYYHKVTTSLAPLVLQEEVIKCHQTLTAILGKRPTLFFRPPTMETSPQAEKAIIATGMKYIIRGEELSTHDYERSAKEVITYVMKNVTNGGIITMHMSDNSSCREALPELIDKLRKEGYKIGDLRDYLK